MGPLQTILPLLCMHSKRTWIFSRVNLRMPCPILSAICGIAEVTNLPSSVLTIPPVHSFMMTVVDAQRDRRERLSWVSLSPESNFWVSTRTISPHRWNELSSTALAAASWRFSRKTLSTTNREHALMEENIPGPKVSCTNLWGLGIFTRRKYVSSL